VIIAELQGGENDPDQLLDTEVTAAAFKMHPYRNPTIGWLSDLRSMTRDELYQHYRRYYIPNNAVLVVAGDVTADDTLRRVEQQFGGIAAGPPPPRLKIEEPEQLGERRVSIRKEGTTAYLKLAYRAPAFEHEDCFPMVVLDAVLTGAKGLNLWASFRTSPPQRSTRLYRALVEQRLASSVSGAIVPTEHPFLYTISMTVNETAKVAGVEAAALEALERVARDGVTEAELKKAKNQLRARLVFDDESVTHLAHQLGYFETISSFEACRTLLSRVMAVTLEDVARVARRYLPPSNRTVGWFDPAPRSQGEA
jgi:zinc protease